LVGLEEKGGGEEFLPLVDSAFARKAILRSPGPEEIAALHPDLVLMRGPTLDALGTALGQLRIPVVYLGLEAPEQFYRDVANLGVLLGDPGRARAISAFYRSRLARIRAGWQGAGGGARPRVLMLEYSDRGGPVAVRVPARSWMQTLEVEAAGGDPVWLDAAALTSGWTVTNIEQIARWDPDRIFLVVWYTLDPTQVLATLRADPQWSALRAVKSGEIHAFPSDLYGWDSPDPRWLLGVTWLAKTLHPDRFDDLDMEREIHEFFGTLYGMDASAVDARIMPRVRLDVR
jgi:iron complex transport system substrate-binding protein